MTEKRYVEIICVVDRSGSMGAIESDAIGGFNKFLREQKQEAGEARFTLVLFNHEYQVLHDGVELQRVPELDAATYAVGGMTALLDAVGTAVDAARARIARLTENERPAAVIVAILTDGLENSSSEYTAPQIFEKIRNLRAREGWEFVFLGADQDAVKEATRMGIAKDDAHDFSRTGEGVQGAYRRMSARTSRTRRRTRHPRRRSSTQEESTPIGFHKAD
ncbi:MAG: VWA domain-containing protein [Candidatus Brocadiia bacterium]